MQIIFLSYIYLSTLLRSVVTVHAHLFNLAVSGELSKGTSFGGGGGEPMTVFLSVMTSFLPDDIPLG